MPRWPVPTSRRAGGRHRRWRPHSRVSPPLGGSDVPSKREPSSVTPADPLVRRHRHPPSARPSRVASGSAPAGRREQQGPPPARPARCVGPPLLANTGTGGRSPTGRRFHHAAMQPASSGAAPERQRHPPLPREQSLLEYIPMRRSAPHCSAPGPSVNWAGWPPGGTRDWPWRHERRSRSSRKTTAAPSSPRPRPPWPQPQSPPQPACLPRARRHPTPWPARLAQSLPTGPGGDERPGCRRRPEDVWPWPRR